MTEKRHKDTEKKWFWRIIDSIEGDKVVWIIVLLLTMFSILAIFSSTSLLNEGDKTRIDFIMDHVKIAGFGLVLIYGIQDTMAGTLQSIVQGGIRGIDDMSSAACLQD